MTNKSMSIFASGAFAAQNLVDDYFFSGDAALFVDGNKVGNSHFKYPNSLFIANGYPFRTIGEANFNHDFSNAKLVEIDSEQDLSATGKVTASVTATEGDATFSGKRTGIGIGKVDSTQTVVVGTEVDVN